LLQAMGVAPIHLLESHYQLLNSCLTRRQDLTQLLLALRGFDNLLHAYETYCLQPIFDHMPSNSHAALTTDSRRALERFRERYVSFREDYEEFEKALAESLRSVQVRPSFFDRPNPL